MSWCARKGRGDAHKIMRQITGRETCISSSTLPLHVTPRQPAILRYSLSCDAQKITDRPLEEINTPLSLLFFFLSSVTVVTKHEREAMRRRRQPRHESKKSWNPLRSQQKNYLFLKSPLRKWVFGCFSTEETFRCIWSLKCCSRFKNTLRLIELEVLRVERVESSLGDVK